MDSILNSIKKLLGLDEDYTAFDTDIIMCINSALNILTQIGVGPKEGFSIVDSSSVWTDFISDMRKYEMVKSYIHQKVRLMFDPPQNASLIECINKQISEYEWRLNVQGESDGNL